MRKDGHTDVASSRRMCRLIIEDAEDILNSLPRDMEASLPTWWTNKLATSSAYMNSARDYLVYMDSEMPTPKQEMMEEMVDETPMGQVTVGNYMTKHFDICPAAQAVYKDIDPTETAIESAMLQDMFFKLEKKAIADNFASEDTVRKAQHYADMINELAEDMNMVTEHEYIEDVHMAKFKELAENQENTDDDDMTPPSFKMAKAESVNAS